MLVLRPIQPNDRWLIVAAQGRFSDQTLYRRFHAPTPVFSRSMLRHLTELTPGEASALVALEDDQLIGVGRWVRDHDHPQRVEAALIIADDWQGRGLGTFLLRQLLYDAADEGIRELGAMVQRDNYAIYRLLNRALGEPRQRTPHGASEELVYDLPPARAAVATRE